MRGTILHIQKVKYIAGSENHLLLLLPQLVRYGYAPTMLVLADPEDEPDTFCECMRSNGIPTDVLRMRGDIDLVLLWRLTRYMRQHRFKLVHTHLFHADLYGAMAARLAGVPKIVCSQHGFDLWRHNRWLALLDRLANSQQNQIIVISSAIGRWLVEVEGLPATKMTTVHYALDAQAFRTNINRGSLSLPGTRPMIGVVARLIKSKGIDILLTAFVDVRQQHPEASLVIIGDGPERDALELQAQTLDITDATFFLGKRSDVSALMREFDVFVLPTFGEGFGLVLLEAMAWGKPIVSTDALAVPEIVVHGETGLLVPPKDSDALAKAICYLLDNPRHAQVMGERGLRRLDTNFTVQRMVEQTVQVYNQVLGTSTPVNNESSEHR